MLNKSELWHRSRWKLIAFFLMPAIRTVLLWPGSQRSAFWGNDGRRPGATAISWRRASLVRGRTVQTTPTAVPSPTKLHLHMWRCCVCCRVECPSWIIGDGGWGLEGHQLQRRGGSNSRGGRQHGDVLGHVTPRHQRLRLPQHGHLRESFFGGRVSSPSDRFFEGVQFIHHRQLLLPRLGIPGASVRPFLSRGCLPQQHRPPPDVGHTSSLRECMGSAEPCVPSHGRQRWSHVPQPRLHCDRRRRKRMTTENKRTCGCGDSSQLLLIH